MTKSIIATAALVAAFFMPAWAGPPKDAVRSVKEMKAICTPTLSSLMTAMTVDYAVHVSLTYKETNDSYVMIIENPNTETAGIIHIDLDGACLISSGVEAKHHVRPEGMAPPKIDIYNTEENEVEL